MPRNAFDALHEALRSDWRVLARPEQLPPEGRWTVWLQLGGRGVGKTRTGSEWVNSQARAGVSPIAMVASTAADARDVMVEGVSGVLACSPAHFRPEYLSTRRSLVWPNGVQATCFSADEPERLRGPNFAAAWCDEVGVWRYPQVAWDNLMLALRHGRNPRVVVSTTPRPTKLLRYLVSRADPGNPDAFTVLTKSRTVDNAANLAPAFLDTIIATYQGTRLGRQELDAELLDDVPGALWQRAWIDEARVNVAPADLTRVVVAVDPAVSSGEGSNETGIIVVGRSREQHGYVLDDLSGKFQPEEWARRAIEAYHRFKADRIVAEANQGGDLVRATIRAVDANVPFTAVHASRGKVVRAEPVSTRYEQLRIHHVGTFALLEDQMCSFTADFDRARAGYSPDRVDALVWALTELVGGYEQRKINYGALAQTGPIFGPSRWGPSPDRPLGDRPTLTQSEISNWGSRY
jgi:predicted phage terminase large subunit-like protein